MTGLSPRIDGRRVTRELELEADFVVVGSGPGGAASARVLAESGASTIVLEEGGEPPTPPATNGFAAMSTLYRDLGTSVLLGHAPIPYLQGVVLGGTSVINGAISWRLPRDVHEEWVRDDPAIGEALPFSEIEARTDRVETDLGIAPTSPEVAGRKSSIVAEAAERLGWAHRPISRNTPGCRGSGRCLEGCPNGAKASMDRVHLRIAEERGATIASSMKVTKLLTSKNRVTEVLGRGKGGGRFRVRPRRAVVVAASAVGTPALLIRSGITDGPVGQGFQCHPGISMAARFGEPITAWLGATQGHEVIEFRGEGIKLEVLGYDLSILLLRTKGVGRALAADKEQLDRFLNMGAAIRASAQGSVTPGLFGGVRARFQPNSADLAKIRRGLRLMGELLLEAGALEVLPGVFGFTPRITDRRDLERLELEGPRDARAYSMAVTHMFGTARMGSDPRRSVVRPDFSHHRVRNLFVADSSVFPTNTGVNPQTSILALATLCGEQVMRSA
ncbi:MAG: GMC family oxidoreductase [Deltaproteobacteria bacterium]|nr:GMC family oxidoreductase [Deltaproteobacteria bacterium]